MNLEVIKSKLDRLNRFYEFMASNPSEISPLDRDSFLMQLRELYVLALDEAADQGLAANSAKLLKEEPKKVEEPKKKPQKKGPKFVFNTAVKKEEELQKAEVKKEEPKAKVEEKKVQKEEPKKEVEKEKQIPVVEKVVEEPKIEHKEEPKAEEKPPKEEVLPKEEPKAKVEEKTAATGDFNEEFEELFLHKQATDLAAKLSESPIKDLNEKLGLNEKFHYINELFGGDVAKFKESIDYLNSAENFENARRYIEKELVEQFNWMKKLKKALAKDFIKLVRRRYM